LQRPSSKRHTCKKCSLYSPSSKPPPPPPPSSIRASISSGYSEPRTLTLKQTGEQVSKGKQSRERRRSSLHCTALHRTAPFSTFWRLSFVTCIFLPSSPWNAAAGSAAKPSYILRINLRMSGQGRASSEEKKGKEWQGKFNGTVRERGVSSGH